jgi:glycosyltransferase involved in cell wall biosynthesis
MTDAETRSAFESEIQLAAQADCVVTVSRNEETLFRSRGIRRVEVLGHSIEVTPTDTPFDSREGFLFVGAVHDETSPNADSLIWFLEKIFPRIREKLGDVPFIIAGLNRSERIHAMAQLPVRMTGHLPALDDLYAKARVFVAPTRIAAGIPHKIHEAAAKGLPVVATPLLAKQLGWTDRELALGETAEAFVERCVVTYAEKEKWSSLREAAIVRVREECSPRAFEESVRRLLGRA